MPHSNRTIAYGLEYETLLKQAHHACQTQLDRKFLVVLPEGTKAVSIKHKLYGYFAALRKENKQPELISMSDKLMLAAEDATLTISLREDSWDAKLLRKALNITPPEVKPAPEAESMLTKLHKLRAENAK